MYNSKIFKAITIEVLNKSVEKFLTQLDKSKLKLINIGYMTVGKTFIAIITYFK